MAANVGLALLPPEGQPAAKSERWRPVRIRYSHYWPPLGGPNCANFRQGQCLSRVNQGRDPWWVWAGKGAACPRSWPIGTRLRAFGQMWICVDRFHIRLERSDPPWVDFMVAEPHHPYGTVVEVELSFPPETQ